MKLNEDGYLKLHKREGIRTKPYLDTKGIPTISLGVTYYLDGRKVTMKDRHLTLAEAEQLGKVTADNFGKKVDVLVKSKVNQNQFNALVSIAYNIGINGFANSTFLARVNRNPNDHNIASSIMMWVKDKELIGRRCSEVIQYFS